MPSLDGIFTRKAIEYPGVIQMMQWKKEWIQAIAMGIGLPALLVTAVIWKGNGEKPQQPENNALPTQTTTVSTQTITVPVITGDQTVQMELEEYLLGVLLAEVPADFATEAIKAQAVAARTFTLRSCLQTGNHTPNAVCTDSSCCQGYLSPLRYIQQGGTSAQIDKFRSALSETADQVVCYEGELIVAAYFSCSGGSTEDALAVWGQDYPYLQSVESPGEEHAAYYTDQKEFTVQAFEEALGITLSGVPGSWFGVITYTQGGGVKTADICGVTFTGTDLRKKLSLRSTAFTLAASETGITVYTRGQGHRVGMSQYGADAMARSGSDYRQILLHYYPGTGVQSYRMK